MQWLRREEPGAVNIGPRGERRRRTLGWVTLAVAVVFTVVAVLIALPRAWRALAFIPYAVGLVDLLEAREKTCVVFAARGARDLEDGEGLCSIRHSAERALLRRQAWGVLRDAAIGAAVLTAITIAL